MNNTYVTTLTILTAVLDEQRSLSHVLQEQAFNDNVSREWSFGVLRYYNRLYALLALLCDQPAKLPRLIQLLICLGLYQLIEQHNPDYAIVDETVKHAKYLENTAFAKVVNACLRRFLRERTSLEKRLNENDNTAFAHPHWLIRKIKKAYPEQWQEILKNNNIPAPLTLRINPLRCTREKYLELLQAQNITAIASPIVPYGILLGKSQPVTTLPGYAEGYFSVQDGAAQLAPLFMDLKHGLRVLDACAAPGGKTTAILETCPQLKEVVALEIDAHRLARIEENAHRLGVKPAIKLGDASQLDWWDGEPFDRILCDMPCSATGIIRRHPDIKWLRKSSDIEPLTQVQRKILANLWQVLKPGGILLYATCSILPEENKEQIKTHLSLHPNCIYQNINTQYKLALPTEYGTQILPNTDNMDGFYYAKLEKQPLAKL